MQLDLTGAVQQLQKMMAAFVQRLPYIAVALLVFLAFYLAAKVLRGVTRRIFQTRAPQERRLRAGAAGARRPGPERLMNQRALLGSARLAHIWESLRTSYWFVRR